MSNFTRTEVINTLLLAFFEIQHAGLSIEPIAVAQDIEDELDGDYEIRVCVETEIEGKPDKFFVHMIRMHFYMAAFQEASKDQLIELAANLTVGVKQRMKVAASAENTMFVTADGVETLATLLNQTTRKMESH